MPPLPPVLRPRRPLHSDPTILLLHFSSLVASAAFVMPVLIANNRFHSSTAAQSQSPEEGEDELLLQDSSSSPPPHHHPAPLPSISARNRRRFRQRNAPTDQNSLLRLQFRKAIQEPWSQDRLLDALNEAKKAIKSPPAPSPLTATTILHSLLRYSQSQKSAEEQTRARLEEPSGLITSKAADKKERFKKRLEWLKDARANVKNTVQEVCTAVEGKLLKTRTKVAMEKEFSYIRFIVSPLSIRSTSSNTLDRPTPPDRPSPPHRPTPPIALPFFESARPKSLFSLTRDPISSFPVPSRTALFSLSHLLRRKFDDACRHPNSKSKVFDALFTLRQLNLARPPPPSDPPDQPNHWIWKLPSKRWVWNLPATSALHGLIRLRAAKGGVRTDEEKEIIEVILRNAKAWDKLNGSQSLSRKTLDRLVQEKYERAIKPGRRKTRVLSPLETTRRYVEALVSPTFATSRSPTLYLYRDTTRSIRTPLLVALSVRGFRPRSVYGRLKALEGLSILLTHLWTLPPSKRVTMEILRILRFLAVFVEPLRIHTKWMRSTPSAVACQETRQVIVRRFLDICRSLPSSPHRQLLQQHDTLALLKVVHSSRDYPAYANLRNAALRSVAPLEVELENERLKSRTLSSSKKISLAIAAKGNSRTVPILINSLDAMRDRESIEKLLYATMPELDYNNASSSSEGPTPPPRGRTPYLYSAFLRALVRAGRTGLAERVFRQMRWAAMRSREAGADVQEKSWVVPSHAFVLMLRMYAREAQRPSRLPPPPSPSIVAPSSPTSISSAPLRPQAPMSRRDNDRVVGWGRRALRVNQRRRRRSPIYEGSQSLLSSDQFLRRVAASIVADYELVQSSEGLEREKLETAIKNHGERYAKEIWSRQ